MRAVLLSVLFILGTVSSYAAPIIGQVTLGGVAEVTLSTIDWFPIIPGDSLNGVGSTAVTGPATGIFAPATFLDVANIVDRDSFSQPAGPVLSVPNWMVFTTVPNITLELTRILPGTFSPADCFAAPAPGQTCTPNVGPTSPYNLSNFASAGGISSNASFSVSGKVRNTATNAVVGLFEGDFGAEFQNIPYQLLLETVVNGGALYPVSYSATITAYAIPEPSAGILFATGAAMLAAGVIRRRRG